MACEIKMYPVSRVLISKIAFDQAIEIGKVVKTLDLAIGAIGSASKQFRMQGTPRALRRYPEDSLVPSKSASY